MMIKKLIFTFIVSVSTLYASNTALSAYKNQDFKTAFTLYMQDAKAGDTTAQNALSYLYFNGIGTPKNTKEGIFWLEKSAHSMNAQAQYDLAMMYLSGHNVKQDSKLAFTWLDSASDLGHLDAKYNEALMYYEGDIVDRNVTKSLQLLESAAEGGHQKSIANIGRIYMQELKFSQAKKWLEMNVKNGDSEAQYLLDTVSQHEAEK